MSRFHLTAALGIGAAILIGASATAAPRPDDQRVVVIVKATDAELHTPAGAKALALRVRNAAAEACGRDDEPNAVRFSEGFIKCREAAIDQAIQDIGSPMLADALGRSPQVLARSGR